jgi:1,4-alpha-glucan branching enzyme
MPKGFLLLLLHAHLPYVRHPEYDYFLEENWLYEAAVETYIPLLDMFERLLNDRVDFRITLSLSPTLLEMFSDRLLNERLLRHINKLIELTAKELRRNRRNASLKPLCMMYHKRFKRIKRLYENRYGKDLVKAFKALKSTEQIEIITTSATHAYLPNLAP